jgi:ankyrin repeat protein
MRHPSLSLTICLTACTFSIAATTQPTTTSIDKPFSERMRNAAKAVDNQKRLDTGLALAVAKNNKAEAERLIAAGANVNGQAVGLDSPLAAAVSRSNVEMIRLLVKDHGATLIRFRGSYLEDAVQRSDAETVKTLIELGANPKAPAIDRPSYPTTLLNFAAARRDRGVFDAIAAAYDDLNVKDIAGNNPLLAMAMFSPLRSGKDTDSIVQTLLKAGVDPYAKTKDRNWSANLKLTIDTPLRIAATQGDSELVDILLDHVKYDAAELTYTLPLAARWCRTPTVEKLLDAGAVVGGDPAAMPTALYRAAEWWRTDTIKLLLDRGADINATSGTKKRTALHIAVARATPETVKLLLERGADIALKDADGNDAISLAKLRLEKGRENQSKYMGELEKLPDAGKQIIELLAANTAPTQPAKEE